MTIAGHSVDLARRGFIESSLVVLVVAAVVLWRVGDRLSA